MTITRESMPDRRQVRTGELQTEDRNLRCALGGKTFGSDFPSFENVRDISAGRAQAHDAQGLPEEVEGHVGNIPEVNHFHPQVFGERTERITVQFQMRIPSRVGLANAVRADLLPWLAFWRNPGPSIVGSRQCIQAVE